MKYGLSEQQLTEIKDILASYDAVEEAILFGSRAIDTYKEASDVDIAIKGEKADWSLAMTIKDHLEEETWLPFFFDVVAYSAIDNKALKKHIDCKGKVLYLRGGIIDNGEWKIENELSDLSACPAQAEWREFSLEDFADIHNQTRIPLSKMERSKRQGRFPYYGASGVIDHVDGYLFDGEFVLISEDGENLKSRKTPIAFKAKGKFWVNNHAHILRGKKDFHNNLIVYYFKNLDLHEYITGAVQPKLNKANLLSIPFILPEDENEQKAIAEVLSSLDDKIDLLHRQNKTLEQMAETLFRQWFVEEAGEDWEYDELQHYVSVVDNRGKTPPNHSYKSPYPLIEVNALGKEDRLVDYSVIRKYVDEDTYKNWFRNKPIKYDTLLSTVGSIGAISMYLLEEGNVAQNVIGLSAKGISSLYLFQVLKYKTGEILQLDIGGVQPSIKVPHLLSLIIPIPPLEMQKDFENQVIEFVSKMERNYKQIRTLQSLRDTLLPKLMSGEIRVQYDKEAP